ncbi:MAG: NAD-dependent epimerase/dehydratase family protein [Minisyncoccia bacterium]
MKGKLILVTGGEGFVGMNLCARLVKDGNRVISLDNHATSGEGQRIDGVDYRVGHTKDIAKLISESPDLIYHLAEYSRVEKSFEDIAMVWDLNIVGTFNVLEFWRQKKCKLVYAGSSTKFADDGMGRNQSPYAWTKAANTELVGNYGAWFGLPFATTYFYNVYGLGERAGDFGTLIEIFRQKRLRGEKLSIVAPGTQRRNFTHVNDIVAGLILVGEKGEGDNFGLGNKKDYSVLEVAEMFGGETEILPKRQGNRLSSSVDSVRSEALGWKAECELSEYIRDSLAA